MLYHVFSSFGAMSYICMDGCMHCLGNSLKKLLHWFDLEPLYFSTFLDQHLSLLKHLTSSATAGLWGGICESICPPVLQEQESVKALCFLSSLQGSGTLAKAEHQIPKLFLSISDLWQLVLFPYSPLCVLIDQM